MLFLMSQRGCTSVKPECLSAASGTRMKRHDSSARAAPRTKRFKGTQLHVCNNDQMHPRSRHYNATPNFFHLAEIFPELSPFVFTNRFQQPGFRFKSPEALLALTRCLFKLHYGISWTLPAGYLCPTLPSRANYIHYVADLLASDIQPPELPVNTPYRSSAETAAQQNTSSILAPPTGPRIRGIDVGIGANAVYSLLCAIEFRWSMLGTDIAQDALDHAQTLIQKNALEDLIQLRLQQDPANIFDGVLDDVQEPYAFCVCNPPFHASASDLQQNAARNLEAQPLEVVCPGGELQFVARMISESTTTPFRRNIIWFTTLVAKAVHIKPLQKAVRDAQASCMKLFTLYQGKHTRWVIAWTFFTAQERKALLEQRP